ncbi:MAG TPA: hypothetical protein VJR30_15520 [Bradyrhizobium sp.]|nr:hypothetical protein [Bradyrhizobium sp.]
MRRTAVFLAAAATLGLGCLSTPALAGGLVAVGGLPPTGAVYGYYGGGPAYSGVYGPLAYDSYALAFEYPIYTGREVTAVAVEMVNSRFFHRRVAGPGVAYYRSYLQRPYRIHANW